MNPSIIPLAPAGIDMLSDITSLVKGAVRDAVNVNIKAETVSRRPGFRQVSSFPSGHSLWGSADQGYGLYVRDQELRMLAVVAGQVVSKGLCTLRATAPMSYHEASTGDVYATNGTDLLAVKGQAAEEVGQPDPAGAPPCSVILGAMPPGKYSLAYSTVSASGHESALSALAHVELVEAGGVRLAPKAEGRAVRVYATQQNGDVLYMQAEYPVGLTAFELTALKPGKAASTQYLTRMPAGSIVRTFNGRLLVARGDTLIFSEPMNYGLTSRRHNFIQFGAPIRMVEAVVGGVYVGTEETVFFLRGGGPDDFRQVRVSQNVPFPNASCMAPASYLPEKKRPDNMGRVALWLGTAGYSAGMDSGETIELQSEMVRLPAAGHTASTPFMKDGNRLVVSIVESPDSTGFGSAAAG